MLEHVHYLGHELVKSSFELLNREPGGKGYYKYAVKNAPKAEIIERDNKTKLTKLLMNSSVTGYLGDDDENDNSEKVFELSLEFILNFDFPKDFAHISNCIDENFWYFENYAYLASRNIANAILEHSSQVSSVYLPTHRVHQED
ncbi:hypothetical protein ACN3E9_20030 [Vibrio pectenicida]|uniref:hypothetical protein n=1 Tax=Vibrio pectenicida TaxID=62763 RepID=UPI003B9A720E